MANKELKPVKDREYYTKIIKEILDHQYNYIPVPDMRGDGYEYFIYDLDEKYPPYWFLTSHGRLFSVKDEKFKQLTPYIPPNAKKNRWYYTQNIDGKSKKRFVHQMVAAHCCENPYGKDVNALVHHITPTKKFGRNDCFIANQSCNLQWILEPPHKQISFEFAVKEPEDILEERLEKVFKNEKDAPTWTNFTEPELFEKWLVNYLQSMQKSGIPFNINVYPIEDIGGDCFRNHDVSYRELKNPTIKLIEE